MLNRVLPKSQIKDPMREIQRFLNLVAAGWAAGSARGSAGRSGLAGGSTETGGKGGNSPVFSTM